MKSGNPKGLPLFFLGSRRAAPGLPCYTAYAGLLRKFVHEKGILRAKWDQWLNLCINLHGIVIFMRLNKEFSYRNLLIFASYYINL